MEKNEKRERRKEQRGYKHHPKNKFHYLVCACVCVSLWVFMYVGVGTCAGQRLFLVWFLFCFFVFHFVLAIKRRPSCLQRCILSNELPP